MHWHKSFGDFNAFNAHHAGGSLCTWMPGAISSSRAASFTFSTSGGLR